MTKNILLVEYDESTIHAIKELFHLPVFELVVANDGEAAKQLLKNRPFDLMITAAMLPRFHGFNLALAVSQDHPGLKIIIISAIYKGLEYRHQAITQYRANDFFEKPLDKEKFKKRVLDLLGVSEAEVGEVSKAATTRVPVFDTAKIPAPKFDEDEANKLSSADIFGDLIQKIEKVPEFEIDLGEGPKAAAKREEPRQPDAGQTVPLKKVPAPPAGGVRKPEPGKTQAAGPSFDLDKLKEVRKPAAKPASPPSSATQRIDISLDSLRPQQVKREVPKDQHKIEDDIARKFEDTLSGLGLGVAKKPAPAPKPAAAAPAEQPPKRPEPRQEPRTVVMPEIKVTVESEPRPAAPPEPKHAPEVPQKVIVKEVQKTQEDEIILLDEDKLQEPRPTAPAPAAPAPAAAPPAPPAPERMETREAKKIPEEAKPEKKPAPEVNPNEVGDYVLLGMIARGGMAEIYKAKKKGVKGFEKVIAIKKILSGYGEDDKYIEMLVDEAKIAAELSHPNIVQIYDLGRKDNYYFIAMEYVLGKDLREIQTRLRERDKWFPEDIAIFLTIKILEALNYAHKAKDSRGRPLEIVHRDVSPPNILISYNGDVKLTDFGVSKASIKIHQTLSGALKGKLLYMSPEQACGESTIDYRSDLYSVGVVLFELLTGKKLFLDTSEMMVLKKVQNGEIISPREVNPDIDPALEKILLTSLNKECDKRYQSAAAMISDLEAYVHKKYDRAPGPVHLSHFIYGLFEADIHREGIKVDLKPIPFVPRQREAVKPPAPAEKPKPQAEVHVAAPPPAPPPPPTQIPETEGVVSISFEEEKAMPYARKRDMAEKPSFKPESMFKELDKEKKKSPLLPILVVLLLGAIAAGLYFMVFNKPAKPAEAQPPVQEQAGASETGTATTPASGQAEQAGAQDLQAKKIAAEFEATQKLLDEAKKKQEDELKKIADAELKKQQDERRRKAEADRVKKVEEEDRLKAEETARLQLEEENRKKQEEADRLKKEEDDRKKAEELKRAEQNRVKEGDIVPLGEVDSPPVAVSTPQQPSIPTSIRSNMADSQTVMFSVLINQSGDVEVVRMLQKTNIGQLNTILTDLVKTWKYKPATKNSVRVKVWKTVPLTIKK